MAQQTETPEPMVGSSPILATMAESGMAFDPTQQHLDLTKEEKRRTTALTLALGAYREFIIRDADYLREAHNQAREKDGAQIRPATMEGIVRGAILFDEFISGTVDRNNAGDLLGFVHALPMPKTPSADEEEENEGNLFEAETE